MRKFISHKKSKRHFLLLHQPNQTVKNSSIKNSTTTTNKNATIQKPLNSTNTKITNTTTNNTLSNKSLNDTSIKSNTTTLSNQTNNKNINQTSKSNSTTNSTKIIQQQKHSVNIPWVPIICVLAGILLIAFIVWIILTIRKRIDTTKKYNQTPEHFIEKPNLSLNQQKNLKLHKVQRFKKYTEEDIQIQDKKQYGGLIYQLSFMNQKHNKFTAAYWTKQLKTDCYFQVQIDTLDSEIQFGFVNSQYFGQLNDGIETKIGRVGVSLNSQGNLQFLGEVKYQYRWTLQYGDVIGMGITNIQSVRRVWITKNGILLNPPTSDQIQKWLTKQQLSSSHREAYHSFNENKMKNLNKKQDIELARRKLSLPSTQSFKYYAVFGSWQVTKDMSKSRKKQNNFNKEFNNPRTILRVNPGGKTFRLRDNNLKSGLLADPIEKNQFCNWLPCC